MDRMATKLPELAVLLSLLTLGQRYTGYENRPLGYLIMAIALVGVVFWFRPLVGLAADHDRIPKQHSGKVRIG